MSEPLVVQASREWREALLAREIRQMQTMAREWTRLEGRLEKEIEAVLEEIAKRKQAGEHFSRFEGPYYRLDRYQELLRQTREEIQRFQKDAERQISREQEYLAQLGAEQAEMAIAVSYKEAGLQAHFNKLNTRAVENIAAVVQEGAPVRALLAKTWPDAALGMSEALIDGTALGWNPRKTAAAMRDGLAGGLQRVLTIARTEQLRAYRAGSLAEYRESGVVNGYWRLAAKQARTCLACLAADGTFYALEANFSDHPNGRCTLIPSIEGMPAPKWETGAQWFEGLSEEKQREMMGDARFEAWKNGSFDFRQLAKATHHDIWGDGLKVATLEELGIHKPGDKARVTIDIHSNENQWMGTLKDLKEQFQSDEPGWEYLRKAPTMVNMSAMEHWRIDHPERLEYIANKAEAINKAITTPEIIGSSLNFKEKANHWSITLAVKDPEKEDRYVVVAISLARLPGEPESAFHQVITAHEAKRSFFYDTTNGLVKERWQEIR